MTRQQAQPLILPKGWPRRVRSAVLHAISLARVTLLAARAQAISNYQSRSRIERLQQEISLLREEIRLKDARMNRIPAQRRPHYLPTERIAILEMRAARGWSQVQTADRMLVTPATISSWMARLDEEGPDALVQMRRPVNRFPDFVSYLVRRLKTLCPSMGKVRIAHVLARAGLHLSATTVARVPSLPWALPQCWPFCWWVAVVVDHFSRRVMGYAVFTQNPTSVAVRQVGDSPSHLITDRGTQFTDDALRRWCKRRGIRQRFGAVGKYGSIAVVERLIRTMKAEALRRILVPLCRRTLCRELGMFVGWYNGYRPHSALQAATPDEIYFQRLPAAQAPRFEPRRHWPRGSPCAAPKAGVRGRRGQHLELRVTHLAGRRHLPIIDLAKAA